MTAHYISTGTSPRSASASPPTLPPLTAANVTRSTTAASAKYYTEISHRSLHTVSAEQRTFWDLSQREYDSAGTVTATDSTAGANHLTMVGAELVTDGGFAAITYGTTLLTNGGFETAVAGRDRVLTWLRVAGDGSAGNWCEMHEQRSTVKKAGDHSCKITTSRWTAIQADHSADNGNGTGTGSYKSAAAASGDSSASDRR